MSGAINFSMSDVYGGVCGTTEQTIPEASDHAALVDDEKMAAEAKAMPKKFPFGMAALVILVLVVLLGMVD